jgi:hypothetical protein
VDAVAAPLNATVAPAPLAETFPEMLQVCPVAVKVAAVTLPLFTVIVCAVGLKVKPAFDGVTVYVPLARPANV